MKINFIIPFITVTGGIKMVFDYANRLTTKGHTINVIFPIIPYHFGKNKYKIKDWLIFIYIIVINTIKKPIPIWYGKKINFKLKRVLKISNCTTPKADIIVATAWPTAFDVYKLDKRRGKKVYFIMHYEIDSGIKSLVDKTYKLPMIKIAISTATKRDIESKFNEKINEVIPIGIEAEYFFNDKKQFKKRKTVMLYYDPQERKGGMDGIEAIKITNKYFKDFNLIIFGPVKPRDIINNFIFIKQPISQNDLRLLYSNSDIFVYPSRHEGYGMPPMEAMACKCAVITTNVGAVADYTIPDKTAIVVPPNNPKVIANALIKLLKNDKLLEEISLNGYKHIIKFTWETSVNKLEKFFYALKND